MLMFNMWTQQVYLPIWIRDQSLFYNLFPKHLSLQSFPRSLHTSSRTIFWLICTAGIQPSQALLCTLHWLLVAVESDWGRWYWSIVLSMAPAAPTTRHSQTTHLTPSTTLRDRQTACYSLTTRGPQLLLNKILVVCCPGSKMVERAPQDCWNPTHLPPQTENSSVQTASWAMNG